MGLICCVCFANLIGVACAKKPPTTTFGNVGGCGEQMGSVVSHLRVCRISFVGRGGRYVCIYIALLVVMIDVHRSNVGVQWGCIGLRLRSDEVHWRWLVGATPFLLRTTSSPFCRAV